MALVLGLEITLSIIAEHSDQLSENQSGIKKSSRYLKYIIFAYIRLG